MRGLNKVQIIGTLGADPKMSYTGSGVAIANISVATSDKWKNKDGEPQEKTEWHRVVLFKRLAEIVGEYLKKGSRVYLEGKIQTRKWQDKDGQDRYTTEILANDMLMLSAKTEEKKDAGFRDKPQVTADSFEDDDLPF